MQNFVTSRNVCLTGKVGFFILRKPLRICLSHRETALRPCLRMWKLGAAGLLIGLAGLASIAQAASLHHSKIKELRVQAGIYEKQADWEKACDIYESILRLDRGLADVRQRYQHCLRRAWQVGRHRDDSYRKDVLGLGFGQSLRLYDLILETLLDHSLEKRKSNA